MAESSEERSPGFKKSLIGKLVAVGIFVAFGTVAVAWSMRACKNCVEPEQVAEADSDPADPAATDSPVEADQKLALKPVSSGPLQSFNPNPGASKPAKPAVLQQPQPPKSKGFNSQSGFKNNNGFKVGGNDRVTTKRPAAPPQSQTFAPLKNPQQLTSTQPGGGFAPANRPSNNKIQIPKSEGFSIKPPVAANNNRPAGTLKGAVNDSSDFAKATIDKIKDGSQELADKGQNALRNISDSAKQVTNNLIPPKPNNRGSFPAAQPAAPKVKTLPPVNPVANNRATPPASFDTSRNLSSFDRPAATNSRPSQSRGGLAAAPNRTNAPVAAPVRPGLAQVPSGLPRAGTTPPVSQIATSTPLATGTPGDRKLEGLQAPSLTIEKIAPAEIQLNTPAEFQIVVKNVGRIAADQVRVVDQIPVGTELVQAVPQPSRGPSNQVSWDLDSIGPGQEKRIRLNLRPMKQGEIGSVAQVSFVARASMRTKVTRPVLSINHTTEPRVLIGDPVVLDILVKNDGDGAASDVIIQDDLPEGLEFSEGFRELEYAIGTLGPGQSRKVSLELKAARIGKYRNVLVAMAEGGLQTQSAVDVEVIAPQLVASGDGPTRRFLNRDATHRFAVKNSGTATATNVELYCQLPSGLRFIETNNRGRYDENSHRVYWSLAELGAGMAANVELTTKPTEPGNQDLNFTASADLGESADAVCKLAVEHLVDVFFSIDDLVDPIEVGSDTAYQLRIVNQGTRSATNVQLGIDFPPGIKPTSVEGNISNEIRGQQVAFSPIASMNPGDEIEITVRGQGVSPGDHRVAVSLIADGREVNVSKQESTRVYSDR